jgi:ribosome assembly protein YihI (activator of Der GTPase)
LDARLDEMAQAERDAALEEQDALLDKLSNTVGVIAEMSGRISSELDEQSVMMEDAGLAVELAKGDVDAVTKRVNKLVESNGGKGWCGVIVALVVILIILSWIALT